MARLTERALFAIGACSGCRASRRWMTDYGRMQVALEINNATLSMLQLLDQRESLFAAESAWRTR